MGEEKPARIALDRASAIAHLDKLPGKFGAHKDRPFLVPARQRVGSEQGDILAVLPPDHHISSIDLAREQSHALVPRAVSGKRRETEACEVARTQQLGTDRLPRIGGLGSDIFGTRSEGHTSEIQSL